VGDENKWKDGKSEKAIYNGWVVVKGLKHVIYVLWNVPWERKLFTSENIHWKGDGVSCVEVVVWDVLWNLCDGWVLKTACEPLVIVESCNFSPSGFLLRKDWLATTAI
jgi:hypothetical protein